MLSFDSAGKVVTRVHLHMSFSGCPDTASINWCKVSLKMGLLVQKSDTCRVGKDLTRRASARAPFALDMSLGAS